MTPPRPPGWDGILDPDEEIIWQGRPNRAIVLTPGNLIGLVFGLAFSGFALFWMIMASRAGGVFWMFGLLHFCIGLGVALSAVFGDAYVRGNTWYTLTDRRAFIATNLLMRGKSLKSYPITADMALDLIGSDPASVHFASATKRTRQSRKTVHIGFQRIPDGPQVYRLMRDIQKRQTA